MLLMIKIKTKLVNSERSTLNVTKKINSDISAFNIKKHALGYTTTQPMPSDEYLKTFYEDTYFSELPTVSYDSRYAADEIEHKKLRVNSILHTTKNLLPDVPGRQNLLEVGFGEGFLLEAAASYFDVMGLDYSDAGLKRFHPHLESQVELGDPSSKLAEISQTGGKFSVCILHNVLEHVRDAEKTMRLIKDVLKDEAILVITVPNDFSRLQEKIIDDGLAQDKYWWAPPQHLQYFNTDNFPGFADKMGFKIKDAYGDFPIEFFLYHPGSNYALNKENGKHAHQARITLDLLMAEKGIDPYIDYCRSLYNCGMGRNLTVFLSPS